MATLANEPILSTPPPSPSFYKRKLPESCIPFASTKGKALFKTALLEGNLEGYFPLASQFITQNEPAFCGLGTLCMVLNALEVDPQRKWKGPWRWYEQEMLDCCRPLSAVAAVGISLPEFACLARCNGLSAKITSPSLTATGFEAEQCIEAFRADLRAAAKGHGALALSYSRKTLGQTGDGHFSPIGGFCEEEDMVLVLDVARFKYPSYWIPTALAWESMKPLDKATGQPRGYAVLSLLPESDPSSITSPLSHTSLTLNKSTWAVLATQLTKILLSTPRTSSASSLLHSLSSVLSKLPSPPLAARPSSVSSLPSLLSPLVALAPPLPSDPFAALFLLALLSPKVSLAKLVPDHLRIELRQLVDGACKEGDVGREVEVLATQLAALGECCLTTTSNSITLSNKSATMTSIAPLTLENLSKVPLRSSSLPSPAQAAKTEQLSISQSASQQQQNAPPSPTQPSPQEALAANSIVTRDRDGALFSPSLASILFSYEQNGAGDKDLLKALLAAKCKEDERLAALDVLRAEQLRAATVLAQHQAYWMAASIQQQQQSQYSPTSPLSAGSNQSYPPWKVEGYPRAHGPQQQQQSYLSASHPHPSHYQTPSVLSSARDNSPPAPLTSCDNDRKRPRSTSARDAAGALDSLSHGGKKAKKGDENPVAQTPTTHEGVMAALRARIERNKTAPPPPASTSQRRKKPTAASAPKTQPPPRLADRPIAATRPPSPPSVLASQHKAAAGKYPSPPPRFVALVSSIRSTVPSPPPPPAAPQPSIPYFTAVENPTSASPPPPPASSQTEPASVRTLLNGGTTTLCAKESDIRSS